MDSIDSEKCRCRRICYPNNKVDKTHTDIEYDRKDRDLNEHGSRGIVDMWEYAGESPSIEDVAECQTDEADHRHEYR